MVALFNSFASGPSPVSIREKFPLPVVVSPLNESETFTPSIPSTARIASTSSAVIHSSSVCASSLTLMAICPPPISSISLFIWFLVPSPTDTMAITEAMPMIMPSIVRKERPLFAIMLWTAILIYSYRLLIGILSCLFRNCLYFHSLCVITQICDYFFSFFDSVRNFHIIL